MYTQCQNLLFSQRRHNYTGAAFTVLEKTVDIYSWKNEPEWETFERHKTVELEKKLVSI